MGQGWPAEVVFSVAVEPVEDGGDGVDGVAPGTGAEDRAAEVHRTGGQAAAGRGWGTEGAEGGDGRAQYPAFFRDAARLEAEAVELPAYDAHVVKGLLQTEDYMRALLTMRRPLLDEETIEQRATARPARQEIFSRRPVPLMSFVLEEYVPRRRLGWPRCAARPVGAAASHRTRGGGCLDGAGRLEFDHRQPGPASPRRAAPGPRTGRRDGRRRGRHRAVRDPDRPVPVPPARWSPRRIRAPARTRRGYGEPESRSVSARPSDNWSRARRAAAERSWARCRHRERRGRVADFRPLPPVQRSKPYTQHVSGATAGP